jgi:hypothetical protein
MLNPTTAKPHLIEITRLIEERTNAMNHCFQIGNNPLDPHFMRARLQGVNIANYIGHLKELRYQLAMTPERVFYIEGTNHAKQ